MAHQIPIEVVDSIISFAIISADYTDAARLALVNKRAAVVYKQNVDVAQEMMMEIANTHARSSAFFKVCIKMVAKGRVVSMLEVSHKSAVISELSMGWRKWKYTDSVNFASALHRMVNTPHLRDVRSTLTFRSLDHNTMLPAVMRFVKFMNAKCSRK